ncbi:MAG: LysM peptidoglycan-binding domain-containing protein [Aeromicrobium sp.]
MGTIAVTYGNAPTRQARQRHLYAVPAPTKQPGLRLTRRGRVVLFLVAIAVVLLMGVTFGGSTAATDQSGLPVAAQTITLKPGQTLWDIAVAANPNGDLRQTVDDIIELNSLPSAGELQIGREIAVPAY